MTAVMRDPAGRRHFLLIAALAPLVAAPLVFLVPPGEAPDEPAHLAYVDHLLESGSLPPLGHVTDGRSYEAYQPPLAYLLMAAAVRAGGFESVDYPFQPDPAFAFQRGARAFQDAPRSDASDKALRALRVARGINLGWLLLTSTAIVLTCRRLADDPWVGIAAGAPFALSPQLLFASATVGNDAAVTALAAFATYCMVVLNSRTDRDALRIVTSIVAGLALWAKAFAVALAPAVAMALFWLASSRRWRAAAALLLPGFGLSVGWIVFEIVHTGSLLPTPPNVWAGGSDVARLVSDPWWLVSAWSSFWAKMGWFNVPLPWPVYIVFIPPTVAVAAGITRVFVHRSEKRRSGLLLTATLAANIALLVLFMVLVDWQPQGRYLLPSITAAAGLATMGIDRLAGSWTADTTKKLAFVSCLIATLTALATVFLVAVTYGADVRVR